MLIISKGKLFLIGAADGKPVYNELTMQDLQDYLNHSKEQEEIEEKDLEFD